MFGEIVQGLEQIADKLSQLLSELKAVRKLLEDQNKMFGIKPKGTKD
jgi:hypothetical protein